MISNLDKFIKTNNTQPFNMAAIIMQGGNIVAIGHNNYHRKSYKWKQINKYHPDKGICAEMDAIRKWHNRKPGSLIIVIGFSKAGNLLQNTTPCKGCMNTIKAVKKISKIKYMKNGEWVIERI